MAYQGNPPYDGGPGGPYQGGPSDPGGPHQGGPGGPYQGGPGPYPGGPYGGGPGYANPASQYSDWIHRVGAYLVDIVPVLVLYFILGLAGKFALIVVAWIIALAYTAWNRWYL